MGKKVICRGLGMIASLACTAVLVPSAVADEVPYGLEPARSLTGDCSTITGVDEVVDPSCPYPAPPAGPSGRFKRAMSVAIDSYGNEYVASYGSNGTDGRIDIFDSEGKFISEFADPNGPMSIAVDSQGNLYASEKLSQPGKVLELVRYSPTVYNPGAREISYGASRALIDSDVNTFQGGVVVNPVNDHVYASWWGNYFTEYSSASAGNNLLETIEPPGLLTNQWLAVDGERERIYAITCRGNLDDCVVLVLEAKAPYAVLNVIDGSETPAGDLLSRNGLIGVAVDESNGHVILGDLQKSKYLYEYDQNFHYLARTEVSNSNSSTPRQIAIANSPADTAAVDHRYLFVPGGESPDAIFAFEPPEIGPPVIESSSVSGIGETEAKLGGEIDPENATTEYAIEYVSEAQFEVDQFAQAATAASGQLSGTQPVSVGGAAFGLMPGTVYRFRVRAENIAGSDETVQSFKTYSDAPITPSPACPNGSLRGGPSGALPDCRAYELVTPAETNGNPTKGSGIEGDRFGVPQASPDGAAVSFELLAGALPGTEATGGFHGDPYLARRGAGGWSSALAGPTSPETSKPRPGSFSPDQGFDFWLAGGVGSALVEGKEAHYVRYPDGHSELVGRGSLGTDPAATGRLITEGGGHIVFETSVGQGTRPQLEPDAPPTGTAAVYDRTSDEVTHVVSLLPGNITPGAGQNASYLGASADGNGIAFEIGSTLYLRFGNKTTYEIGTNVEFAGVSEGGARIFYVEAGDLLAYDVAGDETIEFADSGDAIPVNVAPQGARAYFVSEEAIAGSGPNPNGASPQASSQNLYLSEEGTISFLGTVTQRDVDGEPTTVGTLDGLGLWTTEVAGQHKPGFDPSRLTPDGSVLLFQSRAALDGYEPGEFPQIYRYDSVAGRLSCVSCPPTGEAPVGGSSLQSFTIQTGRSGPPFGPYGFVPNLRADGSRAFFESTEPLVSRDTDGRRDVYEWEADGVGSCNRPEGCLYLISSGHSEADDYLFGQGASGGDVLFTTTDVLLQGDQATLSVYDARVGGGFAVGEAPECRGEGCKPAPSSPPAVVAPAKPGVGDDQVRQRRCPKGKHRVKRHGDHVCVKKKKPHKHKKKGSSAKTKRAGR